jgi:hypothetical protein
MIRLVSHLSVAKIFKKAEEGKQDHSSDISFANRSDDYNNKQNSFLRSFHL